MLYSPTFNSHLHILESVFFQMVPRICKSLVLGLSYRQLEMGMSSGGNLKKEGGSSKRFLTATLFQSHLKVVNYWLSSRTLANKLNQQYKIGFNYLFTK